MEQNTDLLLSQLELLKNALLFYAEENNYSGENPLVMADKGHQARFILHEVRKNTEEYEKNIMEVLKKTIRDYENAEDAEEKIEKINEIIKRVEDL